MASNENQAFIDISSDEEEEFEYCDHYNQWKNLEKELEILSAKKSKVSCKIEKLERQLEDFEDFYDQFGADNQQNSACQLIEAENENKWHTYYCLGEELADLNFEINEIKLLLEQSCKCCCAK